MLRDEEIDAAASQLVAFRKTAELDNILVKYADLIEDYRRLKSDFEEERDAREKYKQLARGREQNPFALVLVDGDGYVFHENFLDKGGEGGNNAAHALNSAIASSLQSKGLASCQIMVRIYANVAGLSKALARNGLAGNEARSLAPFVANFNRSYGLTDFVDAGSLKENADFKLRAVLSFYADSPQCKHIYFAACHDVGYISELMPYLNNSEKFTLLRSPSVKFHPEFTKLGMGIENIQGVFRTTPLTTDGTTATTTTAGASHRSATTFATITASAGPGSGSDRKATSAGSYQLADSTSFPHKAGKDESLQRGGVICLFNKAGKCRYGKSCKLVHVDDSGSDSFDGTNGGSNSNGKSGGGGRLRSWSPIREETDIIPTWKGQPLEKADIPADQVAVNKNEHRIDPYLSATSESIAKLRLRTARSGSLCNRFHLTGSCDAGSQCEFSHALLPTDMLAPLETLARSMPCSRRGTCREVDCTKGHICQTSDCRYRGGKFPCKIPGSTHAEDLKVECFIDGRRTTNGKANNNNNNNNNSNKADSIAGTGYDSESSYGADVSL